MAELDCPGFGYGNIAPDLIGSCIANHDNIILQPDSNYDGECCILNKVVDVPSMASVHEEVGVQFSEAVLDSYEGHTSPTFTIAVVDSNIREQGNKVHIFTPYLLRKVLHTVSKDFGEAVSRSYREVLTKLRSRHSKFVHFVDDEQSLLKIINKEQLSVDSACLAESATQRTAASEDLTDGESYAASDSSLQDIGKSFAWVYLNTELDELIKTNKKVVKKTQSMELLERVIIAPNSLHDKFTPVCSVGSLLNNANSVSSAQIMRIHSSDGKEHHAIVEFPKLHQTIERLFDIGKLSEVQRQHESEQFFTFLKNNLRRYGLHDSCIVLDQKDFDAEKLFADILCPKIVHDDDHDEAFNDDDDVVTDGPEESFPDVCREKSIAAEPAMVIAMVSLECAQQLDSEVEAQFQVSETLEPDSELLKTSTYRVLQAFKQSGIINEDAYCRLANIPSYKDRGYFQALEVLELILFVVHNSRHLYPKFIEALCALEHRAANDAVADLQLPPTVENDDVIHVPDVKEKHEAALNTNKQGISTTSIESRSSDEYLQNDTAKNSPKHQKLKEKIIQDVIFKMIEDKKHLPFDFEVQFRKAIFELKMKVSNMWNEDGCSLLHSMVINNRPQFVLPLFRAGCWKEIRPLTVGEGRGNEHARRTAEDIAARLRFRKMQKEIDMYSVWEKSLNLIHIEARIGNLAGLKRWLEYSSDLHTELDSMKCSTLYWACIGGNLDIVKLLLSLKVDYTTVNNRKETLLHAACMIGHPQLMEVLVNECKMDLTAKDSSKKSPLLRVSENGDEKCMSKLLECGMRKEQLGPLLAIAGHYGRIGLIRYIVEQHHIDPQSKDEAGKSALLRSAEQGRLEVLRYLFTKKLDFTETDGRKRNIIHVAADGASKEVMEFVIDELKKRNLDVQKMMNSRDKYIGGELCMLIRGKDKGRDSWHYVEVSRGLMDIFMKKTRGGTIDVAKYGTLLHSGWGADPDEAAAREIEKRFETRRNANSADDADTTPLHIAAFKDKFDVAEVLLNNGADPSTRDKFGMTALHVAAMRGNMDLVRSLIGRGARSDALDSMVKTPADVAEDNEHKDVSNYLKSVKYIPIAQKFRETVLPNFSQLISPEHIQTIHASGHDIRTHLINALRDLTVDINETLLALGSGPVLEESTNRQSFEK